MPPGYSKVNPADAPVMTLAVSADDMPMTLIHDLVENRLAMRLSQVSGVGLVSIAGGQRPAVRVQVNPQALAAAGLSLEDVRNAINLSNVNMAKGNFDGAARASSLDANDQLRSAKEYEHLVIAFVEAIRCDSVMWPTSCKRQRTTGWRPGRMTNPPSSSTYSANPVPM